MNRTWNHHVIQVNLEVWHTRWCEVAWNPFTFRALKTPVELVDKVQNKLTPSYNHVQRGQKITRTPKSNVYYYQGT